MMIVPIKQPVIVTTDEYFGGCPKCGKTDGFVDDGPNHWFCCNQHRTRWCAGSNLFSSWREEKTQQEIASTWLVMSYSEVEPVRAVYPPGYWDVADDPDKPSDSPPEPMDSDDLEFFRLPGDRTMSSAIDIPCRSKINLHGGGEAGWTVFD